MPPASSLSSKNTMFQPRLSCSEISGAILSTARPALPAPISRPAIVVLVLMWGWPRDGLGVVSDLRVASKESEKSRPVGTENIIQGSFRVELDVNTFAMAKCQH